MRIQAVIPTFNEAGNLPTLVAALLALPLDLHILVVDDNSPDGTGRVADELAGRLPRIEVLHRMEKAGLRAAYMQGFKQAMEYGVDAILQMDADFSHDPARVPALVNALEHAEVAIGSRYVPGGSLDDAWPLWRKSLSAFGNNYARVILGLRHPDVTTGFRLWRRTALEAMPLERIQSNGYVFLVEMIFVAQRLGLKIVDIPIHFADRKVGRSKMSLRIQLEAALRVWQLAGQYRDIRKIQS